MPKQVLGREKRKKRIVGGRKRRVLTPQDPKKNSHQRSPSPLHILGREREERRATKKAHERGKKEGGNRR